MLSRSLLPALGLSLAVHAVLLLSAVRLFPPMPETPAALDVVMTAGKNIPAPAKPASPASAPPSPPTPEHHEHVVRRLVVSDAPPATAAVSASLPVPTSVGKPAPAPASERASADDLRQYRFSLAAAARRFKRYPALARERGWEGTAEVTLTFSAVLPTPEIALTRSSGRVLLDEQALAMVNQAARSTLPPPGLKGKDYRVLLPVTFSLDDQ